MGIQITGLDGVRRELKAYEKALYKNATRAMTAVVEDLAKAVQENIGLTDHTLEDLKNMGHPYALAHPANPHSPEYSVHNQGGTLKESIESGVEIQPGMGALGRDIIVGYVGANENKCRYARWVITGSTKMISRDFLTETMDIERDDLEKKFKDEM